MSSDRFLFEDSFFRNSSSDIFTSDVDLESLSESLFSFHDPSSSSTGILHGFQFSMEAELCSSGGQTSMNFFSSSPPSQKMNHLSLKPTTQVQSLPVQPNYTEDLHVNPQSPHTGNGAQKVSAGLIQRSFSSQSLDRKQGFCYHPRISSLVEYPSFPNQAMDLTQDSNYTVPIRRACSTGDLQKIAVTHLNHGFSQSPLSVENSFMEEGNLKVRKYNPEERRQRIHRYRSKRTQRNFNKTIKYACRKTLADSRPRVRGRFARNDDTGEIHKFAGFNREGEDEDDVWVNGFHEEAEDQMIREAIGAGGGGGLNGGVCFNSTEFQFYGF